jgi:hypothetical protein
MARKSNAIVGQSPRHVWKVAYQTKTAPFVCVERCDRCGSFYHPLTDGPHGPHYCYPTPAWYAAHPTDDGKER